MWLINILLLWLAPLALGVIVFNRSQHGSLVLYQHERRWLFDDRKATELTPWLAIKFAALAITFLLVGVVEGVILPNLHFVWMALISVLTGGAATLLVALWVRSRSENPWGLRYKIIERKQSRSADRFSIR